MAAKEWLVPLALAALTFLGLSLLPQAGPEGELEAAHWRGEQAFVPPVRVAAHDRPATVLLVSDDPVHGDPRWVTPFVGQYETSPYLFSCTSLVPCGVTHRLAEPGEPLLGVAGYNGTRVTLHAFDADGELIASNGNASEQARLSRGFGPEQLPGGVWYLGANATAPDGTRMLPPYARAFLGQMRPLLVGLPVGGVATVQTDALSGLYGRLYVTAQVTELVYAP